MNTFIEEYINRVNAEKKNILYAQLRQGGQVREEYSRFPQKTRLNLMSISKSVVSVGAGIAIDEGLISLDEKICEAFPEYVPDNPSHNLLAIKVRHLLTMSSGLAAPLFFADDPERYTVKDWIAYFFTAGFDRPPGERFLYSNFNTYMISCLIEKRAKQNLLEYLRNRLFEPLGIGNPDWTLCPKGHVHAANGLYFNIDELGFFGEMLLREGAAAGRQLVSKAYIREAAAKQIETLKVYEQEQRYQTYGYGYQFWMTPMPNTFICNGNYGQYCLVLPEKEMVISVMSLEGNSYKRIRDILIDLVLEKGGIT
ncbi:MAG: beta-lactamase family protein [Treponema sp.]|nr:beta-lactamase family protein [Treponema sp.]